MIKKPMVLLLLIIGIITSCFLWKEDFTFGRPINHEKFNAYFSSLGAIGTAFSLFLIYRQIILQAEANRLAYAPIVGVTERLELQLELVTKSNGKSITKFFRIADPVNAVINLESIQRGYYTSSKMEIFNTGNGAALDLKFNATYKEDFYEFFFENYRPDTHYVHKSITILHARERVEIDIIDYCNWLVRSFDPTQLIKESEIKYPSRGITHLKHPVKRLFFELSYSDTENKKFEKIFAVYGSFSLAANDKYYYTIRFQQVDKEVKDKAFKDQKI